MKFWLDKSVELVKNFLQGCLTLIMILIPSVFQPFYSRAACCWLTLSRGILDLKTRDWQSCSPKTFYVLSLDCSESQHQWKKNVVLHEINPFWIVNLDTFYHKCIKIKSNIIVTHLNFWSSHSNHRLEERRAADSCTLEPFDGLTPFSTP